MAQSTDLPQTLDAWLSYQEANYPRAIDLTLDRIGVVWQRLGKPAFGCPTITVAGTNGKGSTVTFLEAIYTAAGYRCGVYTSPHLLKYNERIRVAGESVDDATLCDAFARIHAAQQETGLTYFEYGTLAAFLIFAAAKLDVVILEVGLGGRYDATNLLDADVALVTRIALDHTQWLGSTLDEIALEKAGIFRAHRPAIIAQQDAPEVLREYAEDLGAIVLQNGREFHYETAPSGWVWLDKQGTNLVMVPPALRGIYQLDNASGALCAIRQLNTILPVSASAMRQGLMSAQLPGRFQVLPGQPNWVLDVSHNPDAVRVLLHNLHAFEKQGRLLAVFGMYADKDMDSVMQMTGSHFAEWHVSDSHETRAIPVAELVQRMRPYVSEDVLIEPYPNFTAAINGALKNAQEKDTIVAFGSFVTVTAALKHLEFVPSVQNH